MATQLPLWTPPSREGKFLSGLMVNNSLTGKKVEFVPISGRQVLWYGCGPTVYDAAHMGHARTYVTFDVLRRIMTDYLGYNVRMCMNITDIDDKIIKRSLEQNLRYSEFAAHWERQFFADMTRLNVILPDVITRVSEYIPEILSFVQKVIDNKYGYLSNGSVYFDTKAFMSNDKHVYGRMEPSAVSDQQRVLEGEGELGALRLVDEKRNANDFVLWKKAKEGEPSWPSPWGEGRPGWHIECSAMATAVLGFPIDIHSGGIDLRFPHHDNELAQCEACYDRPQWVNYFLHSGHLHIEGLKMSKSLKNFITITEALERFSPRAIRLLALMHRWDAPMDYSPDGTSMNEAVATDRLFLNFFALVNAKLRAVELNVDQKWTKAEETLNEAHDDAANTVHEAILDNFNTPAAVTALQALVSTVNTYMNTVSSESIRVPILIKAARYTFRMLKIFGVTTGSDVSLSYAVGTQADSSEQQMPVLTPLLDALTQFRREVRVGCQQTLKESLKASKSNAPAELSKFATAAETSMQSLLTKCDLLRDEELVELGVQLEDCGNKTLWKILPREEIIQERNRRKEEEDRVKKDKENIRQREAERKAQKEAEAKVAPEDYYKIFFIHLYSEFDELGIPTKLKNGEVVSKSQRDKMKKFLDKHGDTHRKWVDQTA